MTLGHEARDHVADLEVQQCRWTGDPDDPPRLGPAPIDHFLGSLGLDQPRDAVSILLQADIGHREGPRRTLDQPNIELLFQEADAAAQTRARHAQPACGCREAALLYDLCEEIEVVQIAHRRHLKRAAASRHSRQRLHRIDPSDVVSGARIERLDVRRRRMVTVLILFRRPDLEDDEPARIIPVRVNIVAQVAGLPPRRLDERLEMATQIVFLAFLRPERHHQAELAHLDLPIPRRRIVADTRST
jgi:AraC-like DNA-binding protein